MGRTSAVLAMVWIASTAAQESISISGRVTALGGGGLAGVTVRLVGQRLSVASDAGGNYELAGTAPVRQSLPQPVGRHGMSITPQGLVSLDLAARGAVTIDVLSISGRTLQRLFAGRTGPGTIKARIPTSFLAAGALVVRAREGERTRTVLCPSEGRRVPGEGAAARDGSREKLLAKVASPVADSLEFSLDGYETVRKAVTSYTGTHDAVLRLAPRGDANSSLRLLAPNGDETIYIGDTATIKVALGIDDWINAIFELSIDNGRTWVVLNASGHIELSGSTRYTYSFAVPESLVYDDLSAHSARSTECRVRVRDYDFPEVPFDDASDRPFTIAARPRRDQGMHYLVLSPNGGETFAVGQQLTVRVASDDPVTYDLAQATIEISVDNGMNWYAPGFTTDDAGTTWTWTIAAVLADDFGNSASTASTQCLVRVLDYMEPSDLDRCDSPFSIVAAPLARVR